MLWAIGWSTAAYTAFAVLKLSGVMPAKVPWVAGSILAIKIGIIGAIAGAAFPSLIRLVYRRQGLADIGWLRFGIIGGCVTGIFVPLFLQFMNILSGDGLVPWRLVLDDSLWAAMFGGAAAIATLKLAQRAKKSA